MKYERMTRHSDLGTLHACDINGKEQPLCELTALDTDILIGCLCILEDKIENGELIDRDEYIDRLMVAKDISGMTDKELEFFAKHNATVRKQAVKEFAEKLRDKEFSVKMGSEWFAVVKSRDIDELVKEACGE